MVERLLTINLRRYLVAQPRTKRMRKAPKYIRERVSHFMKIDVENVKLSKELNNEIVKAYAKSMHPVKLSISIDNNIATARLFGAPKEVTQAQKPNAKEQDVKSSPKVAKPKEADKPKLSGSKKPQ